MADEDLTLHLLLPVSTPMKDQQKRDFIRTNIDFLTSHGVSARVVDSYYVSRKSEGGPQTYEMILRIASTLASIVSACLNINRELKKANNEAKILVKRKDGLYAEIREGMNQDDVLEALTKKGNTVVTAEDVQFGEVGDVYEITGEDRVRTSNIVSKGEIFLFGPFLFSDSRVWEAIVRLEDTSKLELIQSGRLGWSPALSIRKFECSICKRDYETCHEHMVGGVYGGITCEPMISEYDGQHIAGVPNPSDPRARISDILLIVDRVTRKYSWRGIQEDKSVVRTKRIERALQIRLITEDAAKSFTNFFSTNRVGVTEH